CFEPPILNEVHRISGAYRRGQGEGGANTLSASNALFATYVPVNQVTLRTVLEARRRGRSKLSVRERKECKSRNAKVRKVGTQSMTRAKSSAVKKVLRHWVR